MTESTRPRPLVAGNWKMNGLTASLAELKAMASGYDVALRGKVDLLICPPATLIAAAAEIAKGTGLSIGGQDCHAMGSGAHTGDVSAEMLADAGATSVIVGHSERRADHGESDADRACQGRGGTSGRPDCDRVRRGNPPQREAGETLAVVKGQINGSVPTARALQILSLPMSPSGRSEPA